MTDESDGKTMGEVMEFARRWATAGASVVQDWDAWEFEACAFFGNVSVESVAVVARAYAERMAGDPTHASPEHESFAMGGGMHGLMALVRGVCLGSPVDVKRAARELSPIGLALGQGLLGHLPQFSVVTEAEIRFRSRALVGDWSLLIEGGKLIARSELAAASESEH